VTRAIRFVAVLGEADMTATTYVLAVIVFGFLSLVLFGFVHITLERICLRRAERFCRGRGLTISGGRQARCQERLLIELDCLDRDGRRRLVRLLVWLFGVRELSVEDFPEEPSAPSAEGTEGLMTRNQFGAERYAYRREQKRRSNITMISLFVWASVNLAFWNQIQHIENASPAVKVIFLSDLGFLFALAGRGWVLSRRDKLDLQRHRMLCPACGKSLLFDRDVECVVVETGRCWACRARILKP
jgi:hypothetical protein